MNTFKSVCVVGLLSVSLAGCSVQMSRPQEEAERIPYVETVRPQYVGREETVALLATVEAMERARLGVQVQGEVRGLTPAIDVGRRITKNEKLLTLYIPAIEAEQASKHALLTQARNLRDQAQEARKVAYQEVQEAKAQLNRYRAELAF